MKRLILQLYLFVMFLVVDAVKLGHEDFEGQVLTRRTGRRGGRRGRAQAAKGGRQNPNAEQNRISSDIVSTEARVTESHGRGNDQPSDLQGPDPADSLLTIPLHPADSRSTMPLHQGIYPPMAGETRLAGIPSSPLPPIRTPRAQPETPSPQSLPTGVRPSQPTRAVNPLDRQTSPRRPVSPPWDGRGLSSSDSEMESPRLMAEGVSAIVKPVGPAMAKERTRSAPEPRFYKIPTSKTVVGELQDPQELRTGVVGLSNAHNGLSSAVSGKGRRHKVTVDARNSKWGGGIYGYYEGGGPDSMFVQPGQKVTKQFPTPDGSDPQSRLPGPKDASARIWGKGTVKMTVKGNSHPGTT